jgi:hypothetical protein
MDAVQQEIASLERLVGPQGASPLFARLADLYLHAGRPKDALRVCDSGLAQFPYYATGHFVKGRALIALDMTNEARRELEFVRDWLPTNPTVWAYLDSLPLDEEQVLDAAADTSVDEAPVATFEPDQPAPGATDNYFSALTDASPPTGAVDTVEATSTAAETNVFGLPSEAPAQGFGGFGGFGGAAEPTAAETESPMAAFGGFSDAPSSDGFATETSEPSQSFEETVTSAMGDGAAGYAPSTLSGETFEAYAERLRPELGPTGIITLEQFLDGDGIIPAAVEEAPSAETVSSFEMPAPVPEEPTSTEPATPSTDAFGFSDFPSSPSSDAAVAGSIEAEPAGSLDLSGFPSAEETTTPAEAPAPAVNDSGGFAGPSFEGPPPASADTSIEGLTAKLKTAKKITPVIDFSSKTSSDSGESTMAGSSFVTPTLAEIYAKQGWFDDAIKAYRTLAKSKPAEREKFEQRITELEEEKKKQG